MIVDYVERMEAYGAMPQRLATALSALRRGDLAKRAAGRYDVRGDEIYALVQEYQTKPHEQGKWEAHRKYIDVQYVAEGVEQMGYASLKDMAVRQEYDPAKDAALFHGEGSLITVRAGMFTIFFPHDVHMPGLALGSPAPVKKVVIKVLAE